MANKFGTGLGPSGQFVKVTQTGTLGDLLHAHPPGNRQDRARVEVWAWIVTSGQTRDLSLEWAGVVVPDNIVNQTIYKGQGPQFVCAFLLSRGQQVTAFASAANEVMCYVEIA
jgi:hypothetical protein